MNRITMALVDVVCALVILIPVFLLLGKFVFHSEKRTAGYLVFAAYLAAVYALVGLPTAYDLVVDVSVNVVPLAGMVSDFKNAVLNVLLFVPLGVLLPLLWSRFRSWKPVLLLSLGTTLFVEAGQLFTFRLTDINDILTNLAGAMLGYLLIYALSGKFSRCTAENAQTRDLWVILPTVVAVMFFLQPLLTGVVWNAIL